MSEQKWTDNMKLRAERWMEDHPTARIFGPSGEVIATVHDVREDGDYLQDRIVETFNACAPMRGSPTAALKALRLKLEFISHGAGAYSRDPITHAMNCIDEMVEAAHAALKLLGEQ